MSGAELIAAERNRQIEEEGYIPEHDDMHECAEIARAAACYATGRNDVHFHEKNPFYYTASHGEPQVPKWLPRPLWPEHWTWKPTPDDRIRELVKAGALIAAEIDRLERIREAGKP